MSAHTLRSRVLSGQSRPERWASRESNLKSCMTRSNATADGPRDALCHSQSCQLLRNCRNKLYSKCATNQSIRGLSTGNKRPRRVDCLGVVDPPTPVSVCNKPARSTQPCIPPGSLNRVPASAGGKGGNITVAGWQVTLCDPIWHVSSRSGEVSC